MSGYQSSSLFNSSGSSHVKLNMRQTISKFKPHMPNNSTSPQQNNRHIKPMKQNFYILTNNQFIKPQINIQPNGNQLGVVRVAANSNSPYSKHTQSRNEEKMFVGASRNHQEYIKQDQQLSQHQQLEDPSLLFYKQNANVIHIQDHERGSQSTKNSNSNNNKIPNTKEYAFLQNRKTNESQQNLMNFIKRRVSQEQMQQQQQRMKLNKSNHSNGSSNKHYSNNNISYQDYLIQQQQLNAPKNSKLDDSSRNGKRQSLNNQKQIFAQTATKISGYYQMTQPNTLDSSVKQINNISQKQQKHLPLQESSIDPLPKKNYLLSPQSIKNLTSQNIFNSKRQSYQPQLAKPNITFNQLMQTTSPTHSSKKIEIKMLTTDQDNSSEDSLSQTRSNTMKTLQLKQNIKKSEPQNQYYSKQNTIQNQLKDIARQLWQAAEMGDETTMVKILQNFPKQQNQPQINCTNSDGWTPIHVAASEGHTHIVEILIQQGANIECKTKSLRTPLHIACIRGNLDVVQRLVISGADANTKDIDGNTPAHFCAEYGHHDCLRFLLTKHPTLFAKNKEGKSPIDLSVTNEVLSTFEEYIQNAKHFLYKKNSIQNHNPNLDNVNITAEKQSDTLSGGSSEASINKIPRFQIDDQNLQKRSNNKQVQIIDTQSRNQQPQKRLTENALIDNKSSNKIQLELQQTQYSANSITILPYPTLSSVSHQTQLERPDQVKLGPEMFIPLKLLGSGSFGEVYLVKEKKNGHLYAMKVLNKQKIMGQNLVRYAKTERNVLSYTKHPFIVNLNYAFQTNTKLFLILDFCPGYDTLFINHDYRGDLGKILQKERRFTEDRARIYTGEILLALEDLHKRDIIYRDLKPDNVVLDIEGHAQLTDFGLSKEGVEEVSKGAKSFCGSVAYLAPEMLRRAGHGKSVDWYLLGVLLYEMVVGCPPYFSPKKEELFQNIQKGVLKIPASLSEECKNLIVSLLNRNPSRRLGAGPEGSEEIKRHPFFDDFDWQKAKDKKLEPPKPDVNTKQLARMQSLNEAPDEALMRVFEDQDELDSQIFENKTVQGWSFIQGVGTIIHQD